MIKHGDKLIILDDLVLDVSSYMFQHPGGQFLIQHNVGRDISKYFYGGYSMETQENLRSYSHSYTAIATINKLVKYKLNNSAKIVIGELI